MKVRGGFIVTAIVLACVVLIWNLGEKMYWTYYPFEPLIVHESIKILNQDPIYPGSTLAYAITFTKKLPLQATITRQLRNHYIYTMAETNPPMKEIGKKRTEWAVLPIPKYAECGTYTLRWTATYEVGPDKRPIHVTVDSEPFEIVAGVNK